MDENILASVKRALGITDGFTAFDSQLIMYINSVFAILSQIGLGPEDGFSIELTKDPTWADYVGQSNEKWSDVIGKNKLLNMVQTLVYMRVRLMFDPPSSSFALESINNQIKEMEWRLQAIAESKIYGGEK